MYFLPLIMYVFSNLDMNVSLKFTVIKASSVKLKIFLQIHSRNT